MVKDGVFINGLGIGDDIIFTNSSVYINGF